MNIKEKHEHEIGVVVGRFQTYQLTEAHHYILEKLQSNHDRMIICIGITANTFCTKRNPLGYEERVQMIKQYYSNALVTYLQDHPSDEIWSQNLDTVIRCHAPFGKVVIYGGRDSFIQHYKGRFDTLEVEPITNTSATEYRDKIGKQTPVNSTDFRKGVIYASQNQYAKVFQTVDLAIYQKEEDGITILMGNRGGWRFFGGFVDPSDNSLEEAAIREGLEEVDVDFDRNLKYIGSSYIEDFRYKRPDEIIMTAFFCAQYTFGAATPKEEFNEVEWIDLSWDSLRIIYPNHKKLFEMLLTYFKIKKPKLSKNEIIYDEEGDEDEL